MSKKIDLSDVTFIIPVRIDSRDREFNLKFVIEYLTENFITNIIIKESDDEQRARSIVRGSIGGPARGEYRGASFKITKPTCNFTYLFEENSDLLFHRTRLLNEMIKGAQTPIVVNYDCDVFMLPEAYLEAVTAIRNGADLVYPYFDGMSQVKVEVQDRELLKSPQTLLDNAKNTGNDRLWGSKYGHVQFFKREAYISGGMENENFKSYGAEDTERFFRFSKLGYRVERLGNYVFHLEHARGHNSSQSNPYFKHNEDLFREMMYLSADGAKEYYNNAEYLKKYK